MKSNTWELFYSLKRSLPFHNDADSICHKDFWRTQWRVSVQVKWKITYSSNYFIQLLLTSCINFQKFTKTSLTVPERLLSLSWVWVRIGIFAHFVPVLLVMLIRMSVKVHHKSESLVTDSTLIHIISNVSLAMFIQIPFIGIFPVTKFTTKRYQM